MGKLSYGMLVLIGLVASCASQAPVPSPAVKSETRQLVDELASQFPPEHEDGHWGPVGIGGGRLPETPRTRDAQRVRAAYERLKSLGVSAFPDLVASSDCPRFSFSGVYAAWRNHSVGEACFLIIEEQVDFWGHGYKSRQGSGGRHAVKPQYMYHVRNGIGLKQWWAERQSRDLRQLQIESLEWAIAREKELGFVDDRQRETVLRPLEARLAELRI